MAESVPQVGVAPGTGLESKDGGSGRGSAGRGSGSTEREAGGSGAARIGSTDQVMSEIAENYRYWREEGHRWADEYDQRKLDQPYYHIQELMLVEYVRRHAELWGRCRVLEFGCGVGRHLQNLVRVPGLEVHGYDQSASMVGECRRWASADWMAEHIVVGTPTGRLPYEDGAFDLVYTAEVLVHVRPEDLGGVLRELMRIASGQVFHLETSPTHELVSGEHSGCWWHDLPEVYRGLGERCVRLEQGYRTHAPYCVVRDAGRPAWVWPELQLAMYRRLERDLSHGFDLFRGDLADWKGRVGTLRAEVETQAGKLSAIGATRDELAGVRAVLERELGALRTELEEVRRRLDAVSAERDGAVAGLEAGRRELAEVTARLAEGEARLEQHRQRGERLESGLRRRIAELEQRVKEASGAARELSLRQSAFVHSARRYLRP